MKPTIRQKDPSMTSGIARRYGADINRRLSALAKAIRQNIVEQDAFGFGGFLLNADIDIVPPQAWAGADVASSQKAFTNWLLSAITIGVLEDHGTVPEWVQKYVRQAYTKGVMAAEESLPETEPAFPFLRQSPEAFIRLPFHRDRIALMYERNFTELKGFTSQMATRIQRVLADSLITGQNPKKVAAAIAKEIEISKARALVIARTELVRVNAEAQLNTFEQLGFADVKAMAEWVTAGFNVCPQCAPLDGKIYSIEKARGMIPLHPQCRCSWVPVRIPRDRAA